MTEAEATTVTAAESRGAETEAADRKGARLYWIFAGCVMAAALQGLAVLTLHGAGEWLVWLGLPGAVPWLLLSDDGEMRGVAGLLAAVLYVFLNALAYYGVAVLLITVLPRRQRNRRRRVVRKYSSGLSRSSRGG